MEDHAQNLRSPVPQNGDRLRDANLGYRQGDFHPELLQANDIKKILAEFTSLRLLIG
jgi:hypothetical protein